MTEQPSAFWVWDWPDDMRYYLDAEDNVIIARESEKTGAALDEHGD